MRLGRSIVGLGAIPPLRRRRLCGLQQLSNRLFCLFAKGAVCARAGFLRRVPPPRAWNEMRGATAPA